MIRRPTSAEVGLVGQQQKASLESAEWAKEIYHGSKNEPRACPGTRCVRPHTAREDGWVRAGGARTRPRASRPNASKRREVRGLWTNRGSTATPQPAPSGRSSPSR